jgi:hypothetical protein
MFKVEKIQSRSPDELQKVLNKKYNQGYEFINIHNHLLIFKRVNKPILNEEDRILSDLDNL